MYISLGNACNVKYQIDKHTNKSQLTHFFDWLMTSFETVNQVMSATSIAPYFDPSTFKVESRTTSIGPHKNTTHHTVTLTALHGCVSIHDIVGKYDAAAINRFIEIYTRRYARLLDEIRSGRKIVFIYNGPVTEEQAKEFVRNVLHIHPSCPFTLVIIGSETVPLQDRVIRLKLSEKTPPNGEPAWHDEGKNWNDLWSLKL
jgi:hypothetical protein